MTPVVTGDEESNFHLYSRRAVLYVHGFVARHGLDFMRRVPCARLGVSRSSGYQMIAPIDKTPGDSCRVGVTRGEKEAGS